MLGHGTVIEIHIYNLNSINKFLTTNDNLQENYLKTIEFSYCPNC